MHCLTLTFLLLAAAHEPVRAVDALPARFANSVGMTLVLVPAGEFVMGSTPQEVRRVLHVHKTPDEAWFRDESPAHRVRLTRPFYMAAHEVTNAQFRQFRPGHDSKRFMTADLNRDTQPAVWVSWHDARAFCQWLSEREGRAYGLPTEAEWEYACRAGKATAFHWGDDLDPTKLNYADQRMAFTARKRTEDDGHAAAAPVGSYPPNAFGLYDMLGNVWEWCADWYGRGYYQHGPEADPAGPVHGVMRVCRGGAWNTFPHDTRCAKRGAFLPDDGCPWVGFRVVARVASREATSARPRSGSHSSSRSAP